MTCHPHALHWLRHPDVRSRFQSDDGLIWISDIFNRAVLFSAWAPTRQHLQEGTPSCPTLLWCHPVPRPAYFCNVLSIPQGPSVPIEEALDKPNACPQLHQRIRSKWHEDILRRVPGIKDQDSTSHISECIAPRCSQGEGEAWLQSLVLARGSRHLVFNCIQLHYEEFDVFACMK